MKQITINDVLGKLKNYTKEDLKLIEKAYNYASYLHEGQFRQSGEPYIIHPLNVAYILAEMHADVNTICAGLLHDTIEDTIITKEEIAKEFNLEIANLVDGVTKISKMNFSSSNEEHLANTRKIIVGITEDVRIILIKLADRLHNMRTLQYKTEFKQKENALETMEIFAPLAYLIGAYRIKNELEDISFKYLKPEEYKKVEEIKINLEEENNACLQEMLFKIQTLLNNRNIPNDILVRTKNIYGIYKKLAKDNKLSEIHDLLALKIMVQEVEDCYRALYLVHSEYHPINSQFKDYICNPKTNMYQSLHTTVFGPNDKLVQTQIRTFDMENVASFGLSAYWVNKEDDARNKMQEDLKNKYQFFKSLKEIDLMFSDNQDFVDLVKSELFSDKVYVYTTKGDIIELPKGSTPIDFAYRIHTDVGNTMVSAKVNDELVSACYKLQNKDRVKIITDNLALGPTEDWLKYAQTSYARRRIRDYIR